jgi:phosphatidylinositol alpha 1,6-mannosyltransferase
VAPAVGGPVDLVRHGETGWLFPPDEPQFLRHQVTSLVAEPGLRAAMGRRARASVEERSWAAIGDELLAHYRRVRHGVEFEQAA